MTPTVDQAKVYNGQLKLDLSEYPVFIEEN